MQTKQNDTMKYIKSAFKKYLFLFPIILFFSAISVFFNQPFGLIGVYLAFENMYLFKKTNTVIIIDNLIRILMFILAYKIVVLVIK